MTANTTPIVPATPYIVNASLAAVTACTTRAPTATASLAAANIVPFVPTSTNGLRIDKIQIQGCSSSISATTSAQIVTIWEWDGTTAWPIYEFTITAQAPSTTAPAYNVSANFNSLVLPSTHALYISTTVTTTASTTALMATAFGGAY